MGVIAESSQKKGIYPFVTKNIIPGQDVIVKSATHRRQLMKQHDLADARDCSIDYMVRKRSRYVAEKKEEKKALLRQMYKEAKGDRKALYEANQARRKNEYMVRNGYIKS